MCQGRSKGESKAERFSFNCVSGGSFIVADPIFQGLAISLVLGPLLQRADATGDSGDLPRAAPRLGDA